jgi:hypothetical protein
MTKHPHNFGLKPQFNNIPEELRGGKWCVWRAKPKGNNKFDKIPYNSERALKTNEPDQWLSFDEAKSLYEEGGFNGIGRLAERDGYAIVDIDNTRNLPDEIKELGATYIEDSPSGNGRRLVYKVDEIPDADMTSPYEIYSGNSPRFLTFTGNTVHQLPVASKNGQIASLVAKYVQKPVQTEDPFAGMIKPEFSREEIEGYLAKIDPDAGHDTWLRVMQGLHHQFDGSAEGMELLDKWSQNSVAYDPREIIQRYNSFTVNRENPVTAASIRKLAQTSSFEAIETIEIGDEPQGDVTASRFTYVEDFIADLSAPKWIIKGIVEQDSLGMIYGASGAGKSYLALDIAASIATGAEFHGHKTVEGQVVYMAGEGARGIKARLMAWFKDRGVKPNKNLIITTRITDFSSVDDLKSTINDLKAQGITNPSMIMVDTLARASGGLDENSTQDMNMFIKACDGLRKVFNGATILPIHHTGKGDKTAARGSSVLRAAMDIEIQVDGLENGISVTSTKMKDGDPFSTMGLAFRRVPLGILDEDGEEIHSAVLYQDQSKLEDKADQAKLSPGGKAVAQAYEALLALPSTTPVAPPKEFTQTWGLDAPTEGLWVSDVRDHFERMQDGAPDTVRKKWKRGLDDIVAKEYAALLDEILVKL